MSPIGSGSNTPSHLVELLKGLRRQDLDGGSIITRGGQRVKGLMPFFSIVLSFLLAIQNVSSQLSLLPCLWPAAVIPCYNRLFFSIIKINFILLSYCFINFSGGEIFTFLLDQKSSRTPDIQLTFKFSEQYR